MRRVHALRGEPSGVSACRPPGPPPTPGLWIRAQTLSSPSPAPRTLVPLPLLSRMPPSAHGTLGPRPPPAGPSPQPPGTSGAFPSRPTPSPTPGECLLARTAGQDAATTQPRPTAEAGHTGRRERGVSSLLRESGFYPRFIAVTFPSGRRELPALRTSRGFAPLRGPLTIQSNSCASVPVSCPGQFDSHSQAGPESFRVDENSLLPAGASTQLTDAGNPRWRSHLRTFYRATVTKTQWYRGFHQDGGLVQAGAPPPTATSAN